jgi:hypothetical protein
MNLFVKKIGAHEVVRHFVHAINGVLHLKPREVIFFTEVLNVLMEDVSAGIDVYNENYSIMSNKNKNIISDRMDIEEGSILRYITRFKEKDIFQVNDKKILKLRQEVMPVIIKNKIQVMILLSIDPKLTSPFANV